MLDQLVIAITGKGKVGAGARLVLEQLGAQWIEADELETISRKSSESRCSFFLSPRVACIQPNTLKITELIRIFDTESDQRTVYACHLELSDYLVNRTGKAFDRAEYREYPERFESVFHNKVSSDSNSFGLISLLNSGTRYLPPQQIAPFTTVFCNGGLWNPSSPRLLTTAQLAELQSNPHSQLTSIIDISCDFDVSGRTARDWRW